MRKLIIVVVTLVCSYQLTSDHLACRAQLLGDRSDCFATRSFAEDIGSDTTEEDFLDCMATASSDAMDCRAAIDTTCTE